MAAGTASYASCVATSGPKRPHERSSSASRLQSSPSTAAAAADGTTSCSLAYLQSATGEALHRRLAALWQLPEEVVWERQQALMGILGPSGLDSASHALLMLVRCPPLREASQEQHFRASLKQLHQLAGDSIDRAAVLTAAYKHPWILTTTSQQHQQPPAASEDAAASGQQQLHQQGGCNSWSHELAAVILERERQRAEAAQLHQAAPSSSSSAAASAAQQGGSASSASWMLSPAFAAAAVRAYVAGASVAQAVGSSASKLARLLPFFTSSPSSLAAAAAQPVAVAGTTMTDGSDAHHHPQQPQQAPAAGMGDVWAQLASAQQQHVLLQQLLASCPHLVALPPELLLSRWHHLVALLHGDVGAARLAATNSYLLCDYDDCAEVAAEAAVVRAAYA